MIAEVIVDIPSSNVDRVFDYIARPDSEVGQRVAVPFGGRTLDGYILRLKDNTDVATEKLKVLGLTRDGFSVLLPEFLVLNEKMKSYFHLRNIDCIRLFVPAQLRNGSVHTLVTKMLSTNDKFDKELLLGAARKNATKFCALVDSLEKDKLYDVTKLNKEFGAAAVKKILDMGVVDVTEQQRLRSPVVNIRQDNMVELTADQQKVVQDILASKEGMHLLFGVTGSGKTEVYMHIIAKVVSEGKSAILLVPEISLTPQVLSIFRARFGDIVSILHSGLSNGERFDEWKRILFGQAKIVIGARSAIFAPVSNVGVIILDEEHDPSYQADSNPRFITHVVAKFRGEYNHCPVVFGSATPSLSTFFLAQSHEIVEHRLPNRVNNKPMPHIEIVNMCDEMLMGNTGLFSERLKNELKSVCDSKNQAMLFLNRRGFSSYLICRECGYVPKCEDCDVSLVYHKEDNQLKCHYCARRYKAFTQCPKCGSTYIRLGSSGTQKVVEELRGFLPDVTILRMDFDTTKNKGDLVTLLDKFANTKPCILVGTQMIAKGHDFPAVTLVGIVDADVSLHVSDYKATERTFQLITQVAGRAGRANLEGKVILQTYTPNHYVYRYVSSYDYLGFFEREKNLREAAQFPPFSKLVRILITSTDMEKAVQTTRGLFDKINDFKTKFDDEFLYCRAMTAPVKRIERKYRYQIICRYRLNHEKEITDFLFDVVDTMTEPSTKVFVEVNPSNLS